MIPGNFFPPEISISIYVARVVQMSVKQWSIKDFQAQKMYYIRMKPCGGGWARHRSSRRKNEDIKFQSAEEESVHMLSAATTAGPKQQCHCDYFHNSSFKKQYNVPGILTFATGDKWEAVF